MGKATVRGVVAEGGKAVFGGRDTTAGQKIVKDLGPSAAYVEQYVAIESHWERISATGLDRFGRLTSLVNNAGTTVFFPVKSIYRVNQLGPLLGMKHVVGPMRSNSGGSIVNVGSGAVVKGHPHFVKYGAIKGAVVGMSRAAAAGLRQSRYGSMSFIPVFS